MEVQFSENTIMEIQFNENTVVEMQFKKCFQNIIFKKRVMWNFTVYLCVKPRYKNFFGHPQKTVLWESALWETALGEGLLYVEKGK